MQGTLVPNIKWYTDSVCRMQGKEYISWGGQKELFLVEKNKHAR